jgi:site-specific recombinase XerD
VALLKRYIEENPGKPASLIFRSRTGKPVSSRYLRYMVKDLGEKAGIDKDLHPQHTLRHSFATDLLRQTKNLRLVGKALGHSDKSIGTALIYTHIVDDEMETAMKSLRQGG